LDSFDAYEMHRDRMQTHARRSLFHMVWILFAITVIFFLVPKQDYWWFTFLPFAIVIIGLMLSHGNPLRWWSPFLGIEVKVNLGRISQEEAIHGFDSMRPKIESWLKETTPKYQYVMINPYRYRFLRKKHAVMFKLAWG